MKLHQKILLAAILMGLLSGIVNGQTVVKDSSGILVPVKRAKLVDSAYFTGQYFRGADSLRAVYAGAKGGRYVVRYSKKTGAPYRQYLKLN